VLGDDNDLGLINQQADDVGSPSSTSDLSRALFPPSSNPVSFSHSAAILPEERSEQTENVNVIGDPRLLSGTNNLDGSVDIAPLKYLDQLPIVLASGPGIQQILSDLRCKQCNAPVEPRTTVDAFRSVAPIISVRVYIYGLRVCTSLVQFVRAL